MGNFTPGPWVPDYNLTIGHIKSTSSLVNRTPTVCRYDVKTPSLSEDEKKANSRLIAAAPEMYEMLEKLITEGQVSEYYWYEIRALLSKVRGESDCEFGDD